MKFNLILATICLALGATVSWILKPDPALTKAQVGDKENGVSSSRSKHQFRERASRRDHQIPRVIESSRRKSDPESVEARQFSNEVEAKALTNFAKLLHLDLTQEQRDAAFDILLIQAETTVTNWKNLPSLGSPFLGPPLTAEENKKQFEAQEKRIEARVNLLSPVLNDIQLEQHRKDIFNETNEFLMPVAPYQLSEE